MENSGRCDVCDVDVDRARFAKHSRNKNHMEKKPEEKIKPEWLLEEPIVYVPRKICNPKPLKEKAREIIKTDDKQLNEEFGRKDT